MDYQIVIPARGGSKRFPKKNIYPLNGLPLIAHTILFALNSFPKENIWVNTDDLEIGNISADYGVNVTFRPKELGSDTATTAEVLFFQSNYFLSEGILCDAIILLQATNPLRPKKIIENSIDLFEKNKRNSLASFSLLNKKYGKIKSNYFFPENYEAGMRMQDIDQDYYENGLIYITNIQSIQDNVIITKDVLPLIINCFEASVDIDEPDDILFAQFLIMNK
jgi:CMP-N-acetylneuraminic acid synthetase